MVSEKHDERMNRNRKDGGKIRVSIIIPVYNVAPFLRECLDSVLAQTMSEWEAICVDDGSTDGCGAILDEYAVRDDRLTVIHQDNAGVSAARNAALDVARGDWIFFLDADDLMAPFLLQLPIEAEKRYQHVDLVRFNQVCFVAGNGPRWSVPPEFVRVEISDLSKQITKSEISNCYFRKFYRADIAKGVHFPHYKIGEDVQFCIECMIRARVQAYFPVEGYAYRNRDGSAIHSAMDETKLRNLVQYTVSSLVALSQSGKTCDASLTRILCNSLIELFCIELRQIENGKRELIKEWKFELIKLLQAHAVTGVASLRVRLLALFPNSVSRYLLCVVPYQLKRMGFHR